MQPQKRTRSSGPVQLIVSSLPKYPEQTQNPGQKTPKPPKQSKEHAEPKQHKVRKEQSEKPPKQKVKEPQTQPEQPKPRKRLDERKQDIQKRETNKAAIMTKEKQEELDKMMARLNRINQLRKTQDQKQKSGQQPQLEGGRKENQATRKKNESTEKTVLVDEHFSRINEVRVYVDPKGFTFSVTFNQSDVSKNINKFYVMQILQSLANKQHFFLLTRWGRVGLAGNKAEAGPISLEQALQNYRDKVQQKLEHGYKKIQTEYQNKRRNFYLLKKEKQQVESKLHPKVQALIRLIFDMKMVTSQLKEIGLDFKRMPLGKMASSTILKGYEALKDVMEAVKAKRPKEIVADLSSKFYTHIPHDFGMKSLTNYVLDTESKVKAKLELLQSLQDIQVFTRMINQPQENPDLNELDANYIKLSYDITPLEKDSPTYATIIKYVQNTHAPSHEHYRLDVDTVYELTSKIQAPFKEEIGNRQLLWHGSRLTNFVGILSNGLRVAPPQAPATGYMFGKGVYFADVVSKSANYCHTSKLNPIGCLLLCQVALGTPSEKFYADYYANLLSAELHSVKGVGKSAPRDCQQLGGVAVPNGPLVDTGISNTSLHYNQYVVYDVTQIRLRYLLKVKFVFK